MKLKLSAQLCCVLFAGLQLGAQQPPGPGNPIGGKLPGGGKVQVGNGQAVGSGGTTTKETQSAHDSPVIISDGSVRLQLNDVFADLTNDNGSYATWAGHPHTLLASHTHASCAQAGSANCACTERKQLHTLYFYKWSTSDIMNKKPILPAAKPLSDCDTIFVFLEKADPVTGKWVPSAASEIQLTKRYVPVSALKGSHPGSFTAASLMDQQAWLVSRAPGLTFSTPNVKTPNNLETVGKYRLGKVEIRDANNQVKYQATAANSCTVLAISPYGASPLPPPCGLKMDATDVRKIIVNQNLVLGH